jgi:hypothetical protein
MDTVTLDINQLKEIINDSVRKAIQEERKQLTEALIPYVSDAEMKDVIEQYGNNPKYDDFNDMTAWVHRES